MTCHDCPREVVPGRKKCRRCLGQTAARVRRLRQRHKSGGKCLYCNSRPGVWRSLCNHHRTLLLKRKATPNYRLKAKVAKEKWKLRRITSARNEESDVP